MCVCVCLIHTYIISNTVFQVSTWFMQLYPDAAFPADRVTGLIRKAEKRFNTACGDPAALEASMNESFAINSIYQELDNFTIDWTNIHKPLGFVPPPGLVLTNEVVVLFVCFIA